MIRYDQDQRLLVADSYPEALTVAHPSGPRQVGVYDGDDLKVYVVLPSGDAVMTHHPDHWGFPAWYSEAQEDEDVGS